MTTFTFQSGPPPAPRPKRDRKTELRKQFDAMDRGQWVEIEVGSLAEFDRVRLCAIRAGCNAYWKDDTHMIVQRKGKKTRLHTG